MHVPIISGTAATTSRLHSSRAVAWLGGLRSSGLVSIHRVRRDGHGFLSETVIGWTDFWEVAGHWENNAMREMLVSAVAGALEAVTIRDVRGKTNCFDMAGQKGCNVGDVVRVRTQLLPLLSTPRPTFPPGQFPHLPRPLQPRQQKLHARAPVELEDRLWTF